MTSYAFFFYMYSPYRTSVLKQIIFAMGFFCTICFYVDGVREKLWLTRVVTNVELHILIFHMLPIILLKYYFPDGRILRPCKILFRSGWLIFSSLILCFTLSIFASCYQNQIKWCPTISNYFNKFYR